MQDKFIEEIKGLKDDELIELYNRICDHINYLSGSIIEVVEEDTSDDMEDENLEEDLEEDGGEDDGDE